MKMLRRLNGPGMTKSRAADSPAPVVLTKYRQKWLDVQKKMIFFRAGPFKA